MPLPKKKSSAKKPSSARKTQPTTPKSHSLAQVPQISKQVLYRDNPDGTLGVISLKQEQFVFRLEGFPVKIWKLINGSRSWDEIAETLVEKESLPESSFRKDLKSFIRVLERENLITYRS